MRVAICLSGQTRNFQKCFDSQKKYIIDILNPDVFIHTWSFAGSSQLKPYYHTNYNIEDYNNHIQNNILCTNLIKFYNPKKTLIEYPDKNFFLDKIDKSHQNSRKWFNGLMMYYSIYQSNNLKQEYEKQYKFTYDIVIRSRMDLCFEDLQFGNTLVDSQSNNTLYLAPNENIDKPFNKDMKKLLKEQGIKYMPNDQFAYGSSIAMDYYSSIYKKIEEDIDYSPHHGEGTITTHLWEKNFSSFRNINVNNEIKMRIDSW